MRGSVNIARPLVVQFNTIKGDLDALEAVKGDLGTFIDILFPDADPNLSGLRELALAQKEAAETPEDLLSSMMQEITQPDIPPTVEEVRLMSLHKSKGFSSPYVFIAGCVEGILPPAPDNDLPKAAKDEVLEEARRLGADRTPLLIGKSPGGAEVLPERTNEGIVRRRLTRESDDVLVERIDISVRRRNDRCGRDWRRRQGGRCSSGYHRRGNGLPVRISGYDKGSQGHPLHQAFEIGHQQSPEFVQPNVFGDPSARCSYKVCLP